MRNELNDCEADKFSTLQDHYTAHSYAYIILSTPQLSKNKKERFHSTIPTVGWSTSRSCGFPGLGSLHLPWLQGYSRNTWICKAHIWSSPEPIAAPEEHMSAAHRKESLQSSPGPQVALLSRTMMGEGHDNQSVASSEWKLSWGQAIPAQAVASHSIIRPHSKPSLAPISQVGTWRHINSTNLLQSQNLGKPQANPTNNSFYSYWISNPCCPGRPCFGGNACSFPQ